MILRSVNRTKSRFLSILLIVAVGVGFLCGLVSTAPDMHLTADKYYDDYRLFDIDIKGTSGLTDDDASALGALDYVSQAMPARVTDMSLDCNGESFVTRLYGVDLSLRGSDSFINDFELVEGRMPKNAGECLIASPNGYTASHNVGEVFTLTEPEADNGETYAFESLTVVGIVRCPQYMSVESEPSTVGNGRVSVIMFAYPECYSLEPYTDIFLRLEGAAELGTFSDEYFELIDTVTDKLADIGIGQSEIRYASIKEEAEEIIADAREEYRDSEEEARAELEDAASKIAKAEAELADAKAELKKNQTEFQNNESAVSDKRAQYNSAFEAFERGIAASKANAERQYGNDPAALAAAFSAIDASTAPQRAQFEALDAELKKYEAELENAKKSISDAEAKIAEADAEIERSKADYEDAKAEAKSKLDEASEKISEAEAEIEKIQTPEWYISDRRGTVSFNSYLENSNKINAIARVFPVFFFFVAALVALTTMTRMVEEERTQMGTLKALGYSDGVIMLYYLVYSVLASALGSLVGAIVGFKTLPAVIAGAYSMLYDIPATLTPFRWNYFAIITPIAVACTAAATLAAALSQLRERPASLMRPRAPKAGKRVFLEHIPALWNRMGFTAKVTARNILRYKKRFFMTVFGVAGCTALLLTAFALRDSIHDIVDKQFSELYKYDMALYLAPDTDIEADEHLSGFLDSDHSRGYLGLHSESCKINGESFTVQVTESIGELRQFVTLRDRKSGLDLTFDDNSDGIILTEKFSENLGVSVGDSVSVCDADGKEAVFEVVGIAENYASGAAYMAKGAFERAFGKSADINTLFVCISADDPASRDIVADMVLESDNIRMISFLQTIRDSFSNTVKKIDYIVVVLIFCAGLLAIIVVYNLTNINICERRKELATLRVLGFHDSETAAYIYRETGILTFIGIGGGLLFGIWLHAFVVRTAEVDAVMFGRSIYAPSYLWAALVTIGFTVLVDIMMYPVVKKIDMVEAMKANE